MSARDFGDEEHPHHNGIQMLHPQYNLLFPPKLPLRDFISFQVPQELPFGDPLCVYTVESPDLPPLVTTDDMFEVLRIEPID